MKGSDYIWIEDSVSEPRVLQNQATQTDGTATNRYLCVATATTLTIYLVLFWFVFMHFSIDKRVVSQVTVHQQLPLQP